jgi:hypothetical protein
MWGGLWRKTTNGREGNYDMASGAILSIEWFSWKQAKSLYIFFLFVQAA